MSRALTFPVCLLKARMWALALIMGIAMQALSPIPAAFERGTGSAFSAATLDVAIAAPRRSEASREASIPLPEPLPPVALVAPPLPRAVLATPRVVLPPARAPPAPRAMASRPPDPTAPPRA